MSQSSFRRLVDVEQIMGMPISVHVVLGDLDRDLDTTVVHRAVGRAFDHLREVDRVFSTFREDSDLRRMARGELDVADADPMVAEALRESQAAEVATRGRFSAWWQGWFDPTGLVKGWAVEQATARFLQPLLAEPRVEAVGMNAGGDMQLATAPGSAWRWRVGIADPEVRTATLATIDVGDGAVATSGTGERGNHIVDPRTGQPATGVRSATVVADRLAHADLWATTAVVAGFDDLGWLGDADSTSGMLVAPDGRVRRWAGITEVTLIDAHPFTVAG
ncbi:FAD:protein FMN transferase [Promicromonospora sp. AC04]|uniref:FAD:protein FMN transferase n=1 Tax=Promicromonospora sp. AC04 TaxID=2135723 RepID=UPI000D38D6BC|nr:FAD:protein FMN transferase [Promicromonospora sp. AC04]